MQNYELIAQIGKGSYGKVFTARNYEDHELYVLKRIPFDDSGKGEADAALREANVLALLRHPHIVPYKEFFKDDGDLCLVMAHCEGGDLYHYVRQKRKSGQKIEEELAWQWLVQLLLSLSYCHSKKILHRDVKTQNIFMTADGRLMLGDFGLAKQLQRTLEMARTPIGTPYYMAPEIYEEEPYSFKSDVWALGCVMYEVLTGKPAFGADNLSRVVIKVLKGMYDPLPETYSEGMRGLIASMLQKDVRKRPTANELLQHPLVVAKVQAYLNALSAGGSGWSTWRMKLPPSILVQMAQIIARASCSGAPPPTAAAATADGGGGFPDGGGEIATTPSHPQRNLPRHIEDLMSSEELIEKFGLQSLLEPSPPRGGGGAGAEPGDAGPRGGHKEKQAALLAAALHPDDGKKLHLAGAEQQGGGERAVLQAQVEGLVNEALGETVRSHRHQRGGGGGGDERQRRGDGAPGGGEGEGEEQYESDFEDAEEEGSGEESGGDGAWGSGKAAPGPGAQLLGMTQGPMDRTGGEEGALQHEAMRSGSVTLRAGQAPPLREEAAAAAAAAGSSGAGSAGDWPSLDEALLTEGLPRAGLGFGAGGSSNGGGSGLADGGAPLTSGAGPESDTAVSVGATGAQVADGSSGVGAVPALSCWGSGGRKLAPLPGYGGGMPAGKPRSFTFAPPVIAAGRRPLAAAVGDSCLSTSQISLHETLTNRAAFLRGELMAQLGGEERLFAACDAVRALHRATGSGDGGDAVSDGELRQALCGAVSAAHLELAPLLDELVLLQARFYDAAAAVLR